jgi:hypothetical protein
VIAEVRGGHIPIWSCSPILWSYGDYSFENVGVPLFWSQGKPYFWSSRKVAPLKLKAGRSICSCGKDALLKLWPLWSCGRPLYWSCGGDRLIGRPFRAVRRLLFWSCWEAVFLGALGRLPVFRVVGRLLIWICGRPLFWGLWRGCPKGAVGEAALLELWNVFFWSYA